MVPSGTWSNVVLRAGGALLLMLAGKVLVVLPRDGLPMSPPPVAMLRPPVFIKGPPPPRGVVMGANASTGSLGMLSRTCSVCSRADL